MQSTQRLMVALAVVISMVAFGACKSAKLPPPPPPTPTPAPAPETEVIEEIVEEPITEPVVSEEVQEELPEDLELLNARGYLEDVFFDTDRWDIKPEYRETLAKNAAWLQQYGSVKVLIEGHCDERNTREYNLALGERRAAAVRDYMVFLGVAPERIRTISYGEERPFALGSTEEAWSLNRRSHFVITAR
jgi:peptidoglycan-associated lipoprotein